MAGFLTLLPHGSRVCHASEEVHRSAFLDCPQITDDALTALRPVGFAVRLDQLQPDDCPKYLVKCLKSAPIETQTEGANALLEVFDKVR